MENGRRSRETLIQKFSKQKGYKGKVWAKCVECIYDPMSTGSWVAQVTECTDTGCPLYSVRPTRKDVPDE